MTRIARAKLHASAHRRLGKLRARRAFTLLELIIALAITAQVGAGANVVLFTTGLGTPTGNPIAPVVKLSTNSMLAERMPDIIDIDTGGVISGEKSIAQMREEVLELLIQVASGEMRTLAGHSDTVQGVALGAGGRRAVSASSDQTLKVWDVETGEVAARPTRVAVQDGVTGELRQADQRVVATGPVPEQPAHELTGFPDLLGHSRETL